MRASVLCICVLASLSTMSQETTGSSPPPSVEILGVEIVRGMPEAEVRTAFPNIRCQGPAPGEAGSVSYCSVSDGVPPGADGEVTFKDGLVQNATRNWFIPEGADPFAVMMMLNDLLTRLTGKAHAACAKVETHSGKEPTYTIFALPDKALIVQIHTLPGRKGALFKESLRFNPVPDSYKTHGRKMKGNEWCAYVN